MSRPIKLTEDLRRSAVEEFAAALSGLKMADGKVQYSKRFAYDSKDRAKLLFTPSAYAKMITLLMNFDSEVAWHGVGERQENATFLITDILVYPQKVSGATVEMDEEEYTKWIVSHAEDERFDHFIMQGHSHVNMGTTPSSVDIQHQEDILSQVRDDGFYIFTIWNKKLNHTSKIYDLANNILYEEADIEYGVAGGDTDLDAFLNEAKGLVKTAYRTVERGAVYAGDNFQRSYYGSSSSAKENEKGSKKKGKALKESPNKTESDITDDDREYWWKHGNSYYGGY